MYGIILMHTPSPTASSQVTVTRQTGSIRGRNAQLHATRILGAILSLLIMLALKHHYSLASADQLKVHSASRIGMLTQP